jgi:OOP family OmpA-OmpF porin
MRSMMPEPRPWGGCAIAGGIVGAGAGAASGIVIATEPRSSTTDHTRLAGGLIGAAVGAGIGTVLGHYICDPIPAPPPPPVVAAAPPPPPPPPPPPAKEKLVLRGINFDFDKYNIKPEFEPVLDEAVSTLQAKPNVRVNVNGYTDSIGTVEYNLKLSDRRANAVVNYLTSKGIASNRLIPQGFGKTNFVATNETAEGRAQNRRVELVPVE